MRHWFSSLSGATPLRECSLEELKGRVKVLRIACLVALKCYNLFDPHWPVRCCVKDPVLETKHDPIYKDKL